MRAQIVITEKSLEISEYWRKRLKQAVKDNGEPVRGYIETSMPESRKQRGYLMGGLIPLLVYLDGNDYKDGDLLEYYFEHYKKEFQPETILINKKVQIRGKSTKGREALNKFIERMHEYLDEQYGIDMSNKAINPEEYKTFRDKIYFSGKWDDFISYAVDMKWIKNHEITP
jgi:hypothetical protein